ncbi:MAG: enoyl-CoA hydratase/isomerase family protein [Dehalococcoidia bacterium]
MEYVRYELHSPEIAVVTLDRPDRLNAFGAQMRADFEEALVRAERDSRVRVIIVTGAGRAFCAGADVKEWASGEGPLEAPEVVPPTNPYGTTDLIKPMVAAIRGYCLGAGLNLVATRCDIRIAGESAQFGMPEVARGTISRTVPFALEGLSRAFLAELLFTGDPVSAERALQGGLVNAVVPDDEVMPAAIRMAERIARHPPVAVQATKLNYLQTFRATPAAVVWEQRLRERASTTDDTREGMRAFAEHRPAAWEGGAS